jgi:hypothetical protein
METIRADPHLPARVAAWRAAHPAGTLLDAVTDLELWPARPDDKDALWIVWRELRGIGDPDAMEGFQAMRAAALGAMSTRRVRAVDRQDRIDQLTALAARLAGLAVTELRVKAGCQPALHVASLSDPCVAGVVTCRLDGYRWLFRWTWEAAVALPGDQEQATAVIAAALQPVQAVAEDTAVQ